LVEEEFAHASLVNKVILPMAGIQRNVEDLNEPQNMKKVLLEHIALQSIAVGSTIHNIEILVNLFIQVFIRKNECIV
jgi:hypothetical protein